ncbi:MAG: retropepsin-like aspartic protease [Cytophagales bacterium]|nr:retropepsin-like aspartic protease [Cytophagales bacterium]
MNLRIAALIYLPALLLVPLCAQAQLPIGKLVSKNQVLEVPLNNIDNEILVNAKVRGEEFQFLLDTGAPFFISSAIQKKYDFPVLFKANLSDASGKKDETVVVSVDSIRVGPFLFTDVWAVVINMENETHQCHEFVGNFGSNLLSFLTVQFNLQKAKAILTDNKELLAHKPSVPFSPAKISTQCDFFFPITIAGNIIDTIQFDSGDGSLYEISEKALNQLIRFKPNAIVKKGIGITSLGSLGMPEPAKQYVIRTSITFNGTTHPKGISL